MSAFASLRKPLKVKRVATGSYVSGEWVDGTVSEITIHASVQPMNANDLQSLPENRRAEGGFKLFSDERFQTVSEGERNPDIVEIEGEDYEIASCDPWKNGLIEHHKSLAVRVQP